MPRLRLLCSAGDYAKLAKYQEYLWLQLALGTAKVLGMQSHTGMDLVIIPCSAWNSNSLELEGDVSRGATPKQNMVEWKKELMVVWKQLRYDKKLHPIRNILRKNIGFWPRIVDGSYADLPQDPYPGS